MTINQLAEYLANKVILNYCGGATLIYDKSEDDYHDYEEDRKFFMRMAKEIKNNINKKI